MDEYILIQYAIFMFGVLTVIKLLLIEFDNIIIMIKNLKRNMQKK